MYGASRLTPHVWHLCVFMGIYKHVSSMAGNFTSHYFFKKSLLNSFTFPSTVPKGLSQQKKPHSSVSFSVFDMVTEVLPKQSMPLIWWLPWTLLSLVFRACRHSQHLQGAIPWLQNSGQNWKCKMVVTEWEMGVLPFWSSVLAFAVLC